MFTLIIIPETEEVFDIVTGQWVQVVKDEEEEEIECEILEN